MPRPRPPGEPPVAWVERFGPIRLSGSSGERARGPDERHNRLVLRRRGPIRRLLRVPPSLRGRAHDRGTPSDPRSLLRTSARRSQRRGGLLPLLGVDRRHTGPAAVLRHSSDVSSLTVTGPPGAGRRAPGRVCTCSRRHAATRRRILHQLLSRRGTRAHRAEAPFQARERGLGTLHRLRRGSSNESGPEPRRFWATRVQRSSDLSRAAARR